jgi:hypothetical protein
LFPSEKARLTLPICAAALLRICAGDHQLLPRCSASPPLQIGDDWLAGVVAAALSDGAGAAALALR